MLFHDDEIGYAIIGEAAVNLALGGNEINVATLITELGVMAQGEPSDRRLAEISDARTWLKSFRRPGSSGSPVPWLTVINSNDDGRHNEDVVRLRPENDDES